MKKPLLLIPALAASLFFSACTQTPTNNSEADRIEESNQEVLDETKKINDREAKENSIAESEYQIFKDRSDIRIKENEIKIEKLKQRAAASDKNVQERLNKRINEIEAKNDRIKDKLAGYQQSGTAEWNAFKRELEYDMEELGAALKGLTEDNKL